MSHLAKIQSGSERITSEDFCKCSVHWWEPNSKSALWQLVFKESEHMNLTQL